jgi:hypothetical protein
MLLLMLLLMPIRYPDADSLLLMLIPLLLMPISFLMLIRYS